MNLFANRAFRRFTLQLSLLVALFLFCANQYALALDQAIALDDYNHTIWTAKEGAPTGITSMAQTRDGWLWLGGSAGLYRFDGVRFSRFAPTYGPSLLATAISMLYAKDNGDLLIGYISGGLSVLRNGRLVHLAERNSPVVPASLRAAIDLDGSLWLVTTDGLRHYQDGEWTIVGQERGLPPGDAGGLVLDHYGRLWVSIQDELYLFNREQGRFFPVGLPGGLIIPSPDGRIWRRGDTQWQVLPQPPNTPLIPLKARRAPFATVAGMFDRDGNHWALRCPVGICRTRAARLRDGNPFDANTVGTERLDKPWQMSSLSPNVILEDQEGNIWVGTQAGLERFRHNKLVPIKVPPGESWFQVVNDEHGRPLLASRPNGYLFEPGATTFDKKLVNPRLATATDGALLRADSTGLTRIQGGMTTVTPFPPGVGKRLHDTPTLLFGNRESIWLGFGDAGLFHLRGGKWTPASEYGLPTGMTTAALGPNNAVWFGFRDGKVMVLADGKLTTISTDRSILPGPINFIDASHGLVLAGEDGLAILDHGKIRRLHCKDPEMLGGITGQVVTANGDRWFNGRKGAVHVTAAAWAQAIADPGRLLAATVLDSLDGYPGSALAVSVYPTATQTKDGRIWFVSRTGVVYLDPRHAHANLTPPPIVTAPIDVPGTVANGDGSFTLPEGTTSLRLDYTALSYTMPERVNFRYQLEGVDDGWQDAGTRRSAFYTRLRPGPYRFRITAMNEEGVASASESLVRFTIRPTFVQTPWFLALCATAVLGLSVSAYQWRARQLARRYSLRLQERLAERERIARALHDTLLQSMQGLILRFHGVAKRLPPDGDARLRIETILDQADEVMSEGRSELMNLRTRPDDNADIADALSKFGHALQENFGPQFTLAITGDVRMVETFAWQEIYCIGREAVFNAYQHAAASHIEVEIIYGLDQLSIFVRDDGAGIQSEVQRDGRREGHWGLAGMRERAQTLNGSLDLWSRPHKGTEVVLRVPADRAYVAPTGFHPWRWLQAVLGRTGKLTSPRGS